MRALVLACASLCAVPAAADAAPHHTPIIVIMSHPTIAADNVSSDQSIAGDQFMAASYVKWLEMAGARVMPLSYHATDADIDNIFDKVNGALFMGGGASLPSSARRLWSRAMEANVAGDVFPIWGTCTPLSAPRGHCALAAQYA